MVEDLPGEEWRTVPGHPDHDVSNLGRVRSYKGNGRGSRAFAKPRLLRPHHDPAGYVRTMMDGVHRYVHWAVTSAFHGERQPGMEVDHINGVRDDNRAENLRWVTRQENLLERRDTKGTHCKYMHPLSGDNLYIRPSTGRRECKQCSRDRAKKPPAVQRPCTFGDCTNIARCRLSTDQPLCENHYKTVRRQEKQQRREAA